MIHFVGAGPGAADLITMRGARLLQETDIIIYAGSLVNPALLEYAKIGCQVYNSAEMTLEEVIEVMKDAEAKGLDTVRLHTGDASLYGAIREQMDLLEIYDDSPYRINAMGNALQMEGGFDKATSLAEKLLATEEFDNCYYVASYYCLPVRDFDTFFQAVHAGIRQEASNHEAWNSMTGLCSRAVRQLDAEELEEFLPGVAGLRAELEAFNSSGRMEQIVMEEKNQLFLDTAATLVESKADGRTAQTLLDALDK